MSATDEKNLLLAKPAIDENNISLEMSVTDVTDENNLLLEMSVEDVSDENNLSTTLEMSVNDVITDTEGGEENNLSLATPMSTNNENNQQKIVKRTIDDYKSLLKTYSSGEGPLACAVWKPVAGPVACAYFVLGAEYPGTPYKNGYVMYLVDIEHHKMSKAFTYQYLMDVAHRKNYPFNSATKFKFRKLKDQMMSLKKKLTLNWKRVTNLLEEMFVISEPVLKRKKSVSPVTSYQNVGAETIATPEPQKSAKPLNDKCIRCERLKKSIREIRKFLQDRIRNSKELIRNSKLVQVNNINQTLKRKVGIIKKLKAEKFNLRRQNFLLENSINRLSEKLKLKYSKLSLMVPLCPRQHGDELREEIRNKKAQIKKMESLVDKLHCQLRTLQEL